MLLRRDDQILAMIRNKSWILDHFEIFDNDINVNPIANGMFSWSKNLRVKNEINIALFF